MSYSHTEKVDLFSRKQNKVIGQVDVRSKFHTKPILALKNFKNEFENERFDVESAEYGPIYFNKFKKCYYRVFYHELPRKNENDEYTIVEDKKCSIAIFNENFEWIGEYKLNTWYLFGLLSFKDGVIIKTFGGNDKNNIYIKRLIHD